MELSQTRRITAGPAAVWAALNKPALLQRCIPGCIDISPLSPEEMAVTLRLTISSLSATYKTKCEDRRCNRAAAASPSWARRVGETLEACVAASSF